VGPNCYEVEEFNPDLVLAIEGEKRFDALLYG
jgi:hypothetical protein